MIYSLPAQEIVRGAREYWLKRLYADRRSEIDLQLREKLQSQIAPLRFIVDEALLRNVKVPDTLQTNIEQRV